MHFLNLRVLGAVTRRCKGYSDVYSSNGAGSLRYGVFHFSTRSGARVPEDLGDRNADIFDRTLKKKQRDRAAWLMEGSDPLLETVTENLLDRLNDCKRTFPTALNLGGALHHVNHMLPGKGGIERVISMDISEDMMRKSLHLMRRGEDEDTASNTRPLEHFSVVGDEEFLPLDPLMWLLVHWGSTG